MTARERFIEIMKFNTGIRSLKWEYAYWGKTIKNWYNQGLPMKSYPRIPQRIINTSTSLYTAAWTHPWKSNTDGSSLENRELPDGIAVWGEATYWPSQGFPLERDVHDHLGFDTEVRLVQVEQLFYPRFDIQVLEEDEDSMVYRDLDGVTRKLLRKESTIPTARDWPIRDSRTWKKIKDERLSLDTIHDRFPQNWDTLVSEYRKRDYPLAVGGYPIGFFGLPAHLMGYENLFYIYYDRPDLVKDVLDTFTTLWLAIWEEMLPDVSVDVVHIFEDVSSGNGSLISPSTIREFMIPYYRRVTDFFKARGVEIILVDTDGDCSEIVPLFIEGGATGMYPMEASTGMDVSAIRKEFPNLQMMGGIPKRELAGGRERIDEILKPVEELLKHGGYVPFCDHSVPPEVTWENFVYYRERLNALIEKTVH